MTRQTDELERRRLDCLADQIGTELQCRRSSVNGHRVLPVGGQWVVLARGHEKSPRVAVGVPR
jgi:hypothetical protein